MYIHHMTNPSSTFYDITVHCVIDSMRNKPRVLDTLSKITKGRDLLNLMIYKIDDYLKKLAAKEDEYEVGKSVVGKYQVSWLKYEVGKAMERKKEQVFMILGKMHEQFSQYQDPFIMDTFALMREDSRFDVRLSINKWVSSQAYSIMNEMVCIRLNSPHLSSDHMNVHINHPILLLSPWEDRIRPLTKISQFIAAKKPERLLLQDK